MILNLLKSRLFKDRFLPRMNLDSQEILKLWNESIEEVDASVTKFVVSQGYSIEKLWYNQLALITQVTNKKSRINFQHGKILYSVIANYAHQRNVDFVNYFETGTARGFSAIIAARALSDSRVNYRITTVDVVPHNVKMYWNCILDLYGKRTRKELLSTYSDLLGNIDFVNDDSIIAIANIKLNRIHIGFLDGSHEYEYVNKEALFLAERQEIGDIIIFDDASEIKFPDVWKVLNSEFIQSLYKTTLINCEDERSYAICKRFVK